jgi:putative ABC transport system substrate-binding protein
MLNTKQQLAVEQTMNGENILITGPAGTGKSFTDHLPNVTGIGSFPPVSDMVDFIRATMPEAKNVGTIYNSAEANSVKVVGVARELFSKAGIKLQEITVASSAEVLEAAQALASQGVDAFYIQSDNTVTQGFPSVVKAVRDARIPLFCDDPITAKGGAVACVGVGFYKPGFAVAELVSRVLHGADPASIPITNLTEKVVWIDRNLASQFGLIIPPGTPDAPAP